MRERKEKLQVERDKTLMFTGPYVLPCGDRVHKDSQVIVTPAVYVSHSLNSRQRPHYPILLQKYVKVKWNNTSISTRIQNGNVGEKEEDFNIINTLFLLKMLISTYYYTLIFFSFSLFQLD